MKQLITAVILTATAITAQAKDIALDCTYKGVNGKDYTLLASFDPELKTGKFGPFDVIVNTFGSEYKLRLDDATTYTINRETLAFMGEVSFNKLPGQCEISKTNNKI
jgi:hypothetical protein